jgi:hypothetical protein
VSAQALSGASGKRWKVSPEEIENRFASAGWHLDGGFQDRLVIGYSGDEVSILAHKEYWGTDDPLFELLDHGEMVSYWVGEVPTPQQARELLQEHGQLPQVWEQS